MTSGPLEVRRAGILLHVTSLPSAYGAGDLGPAARRFVDFLEAAGCTVWQMLPLGPTHHVDRSPYNAVSAMAGNPELVSVECLVERDLLDETHLDDLRSGSLTPADARLVAAERFLGGHGGQERAAFERWCVDNRSWLDDYVEFVALREHLDHAPWPTWKPGLRDREPEDVAAALAPLADRLAVLRFEQWVFAEQWQELREYAHARGVLLFGDLPIFVSHDSADVWASRELFRLDAGGQPTTVTGVPPDYFSAEGQRWNNPHYDWEEMARDGYRWWRDRVAGQRRLFDLVRIDHFRGFEAAWHVPADAPSAKSGAWEKSPGAEVLAALVETSGPGTLVAEDLGVITPEVDALRRRFGLPGMKVLQFAFDGDPDNSYLPAHHEQLSVVYTGTHDNDTTLGWWAEQSAEERRNVVAELLDPTEPMPWAMVRLTMASTATLAVVPAQDLLGLGSESRMNTPGTPTGNWSWQAFADDFDAPLAARLRELVEEHDRLV
ncbi:MAG TPA: 4-alpha-glucanotransferase [Marmoricola sp.]|nr:4-alpha-glucanotransferase [Marmoricola sp.]